MKTNYQKNQIIAFNKAIKLFENNRNGILFNQIPQIAFLVDSENGKLIGDPKINFEKEHAEVLVLKSIELDKFPDNKFNLIVSSHPCHKCIEFLSNIENQRKIKNVFYISKSAYMHKIEDYIEMTKENENLIKFEDINIKFIKYNDYSDEDIKRLTNVIDSELNEFLKRNMLRFGKFLLQKYKSENIPLSIEKYKDEIHNLDTLGDILDKKIYTVNNDRCIIIRNKLKEVCDIIEKEKTPI